MKEMFREGGALAAQIAAISVCALSHSFSCVSEAQVLTLLCEDAFQIARCVMSIMICIYKIAVCWEAVLLKAVC